MVVASIGIHQYDTLYVALSCLFYSIRNSFFFFFVCKNEINIPLFFFDFDEICFFFMRIAMKILFNIKKVHCSHERQKAYL